MSDHDGNDRPRHDGAPEGGLLPSAPPAGPQLLGTWVGDELLEAQRRVEALTREVEALRVSIASQQEIIDALHDQIATVDGRTLRHEHVADGTREVRGEIAALERQIALETSLRRDLAAVVERRLARDREADEALRRALQDIAERLDHYEGQQQTTAERQLHLQTDLAELEHDDESIEGRLVHIERRVEANAEHARHMVEEIARVASVLPGLLSGTGDLESRVRAQQEEQRRLVEDLAGVRAVRDREDQAFDLLEQQRASRIRTEERLNQFEERLEAILRRVEETGDERMMLRRGQSGIEERMRALGEALEAQRVAFIEHLRRQMVLNEESVRRRAEEVDREIRIARDLHMRLSEDSQEANREQPL